MSTNHARDDWADARTDETLRRELDALAGVAGSASELDGALGSVRSRVRRRRAAKQAGIGATTLVVAAGLAVGGAALHPDEPPPLPGPAETSSPTPSEPTPSDEPTGAALGVIEDGYQPAGLQGTDLVCGMPADDLAANGLELLGDPELDVLTSADETESVPLWRAPTRLTLTAGANAGHRVTAPTLLWVQDGRVVDVGITQYEGMDQLGDVERERDAEDYTHTTCAPDHEEQDGVTTDTYGTELPAGEYEVRAYVTVWSPDLSSAQVVVSDPVTVVVGDGGSGSNAGSPANADCSAAELDLGAPDLSGLTAEARSTAESLLDAALACDTGTLVAMNSADDTSTNFGGRTPQEFWELPAAEEHEDVYAILARLIAESSWAADPGAGDVPPAYFWPRVATAEFADDDAAWQEAVDVGAVDPEFVEDIRTDLGYIGWRLGIEEDGTWRFFIAGD
jgi:hypothetical protein